MQAVSFQSGDESGITTKVNNDTVVDFNKIYDTGMFFNIFLPLFGKNYRFKKSVTILF